MDAWKDFSPFASAPCAEGLVSAHVSEGRKKIRKVTTTPLALALRRAMSAASGIHEQYVPPSEQHITTTLPSLGPPPASSIGRHSISTGDVQIERISHVLCEAPLFSGRPESG